MNITVRINTWMLWCLLGLVPMLAHAETTVYETKQPNGTLLFSDVPSAQSRPVVLNNLERVAAAPSTQNAQPELNAQAAVNTEPAINKSAGDQPRLSIIDPLPQQTIPDNAEFSVHVDAKPPLREGDTLQMMVDGQATGSAQTQSTFTLKNIQRGTHILQVVLIDAQGQRQQVSQSVTVFVHQPSALLKPR